MDAIEPDMMQQITIATSSTTPKITKKTTNETPNKLEQTMQQTIQKNMQQTMQQTMQKNMHHSISKQQTLMLRPDFPEKKLNPNAKPFIPVFNFSYSVIVSKYTFRTKTNGE